MCGICGIVGPDSHRIGKEGLLGMCRQFAHRGPDDEGVYVGACQGKNGHRLCAGLAHRRLAVIDLSAAGHQPMANEDGSIWITYNGEVYNYSALRRELVRKGHTFRSDTDTEVILHLYEEEGTSAVKRLNGMFAFAIWDANLGRMWLCRDRLGIKPLVYSWDGKMLAFSSEIKALLVLPGIEKKLDETALRLYLAFSYVPAPLTIFKSIRKLAPGHSLVFEKGEINIAPYWEIPRKLNPEFEGMQWNEIAADIKPRIIDSLNDAVVDRMIADVSLGAFLSGGIDSSIVVALMAQNTAERVKTFSIGFQGDALFDETRYARDVARMYRTDHHEFKLSADDMKSVVGEVLGAFDEPFSDSSAIPTYIVSRETRKHVTVALSGDGGDELFAGYRSYLAWYWGDLYLRMPEPLRVRFFERMLNRLPDGRDSMVTEHIRRLKKFVHGTRGDRLQRMLSLKEISPSSMRSALLAPLLKRTMDSNSDPAMQHLSKLIADDSGDPVNSALYADTVDALSGDMLTKVDWMSMRHSLEVRVPFLDYRFVELAFSIPGSLKIKRGITKYLLKEAFRPMLPKSLYRRPKAGFEIPISRWLRTDLGYLIDQYLEPDRLRRQEIFDPVLVESLISAFRHCKQDHSWTLWNLIVFQSWYEHYFI